MTKQILVTGSLGFIGRNLKIHLTNKDFQVIGLDLPNLTTSSETDIGVHLGEDSVKNKKILNKIKPNIIIHCAAQTDVTSSLRDPIDDAKSNIIGSIELFQKLNSPMLRHFIYLNSGGASYNSKTPFPITEDSPIEPESPYGISKVTAENYLRYLCSSNGICFTSLRLSNVYGPINQNRKGIIFNLYEAANSNRKFMLYGENVTRDYVYIDDVISAIELVLDKALPGNFNVSSSIETSNSNLLQLALKILEVEMDVEILEPRPGEVLRSCLSNEKLINATGWQPKININKGLQFSFEEKIDKFR
jgi:UDP-glucose 4-epimerase